MAEKIELKKFARTVLLRRSEVHRSWDSLERPAERGYDAHSDQLRAGCDLRPHGALSNNYGQVRISWHVADATFSMSWIEDGGPKVTTPMSIGFGQLVIGRLAEAAVQGKADIRFLTSGFAWKLSAPVENALVGREGPTEHHAT